jgi:hypothetical protein
MLNVDAGNSKERPDNSQELRKTWRVTWLAILGFVLFVLAFVAMSRLNDDGSQAPDRGASEPQQVQPAPGEREGIPQP